MFSFFPVLNFSILGSVSVIIHAYRTAQKDIDTFSYMDGNWKNKNFFAFMRFPAELYILVSLCVMYNNYMQSCISGTSYGKWLQKTNSNSVMRFNFFKFKYHLSLYEKRKFQYNVLEVFEHIS